MIHVIIIQFDIHSSVHTAFGMVASYHTMSCQSVVDVCKDPSLAYSHSHVVLVPPPLSLVTQVGFLALIVHSR